MKKINFTEEKNSMRKEEKKGKLKEKKIHFFPLSFSFTQKEPCSLTAATTTTTT